MMVFFLIYKRYISIFQLIRECWIFVFLIVTFVKTSDVMSEFQSRILNGILPYGVDFLLLILLVSLFTFSTLKYLNENTFGYLKERFIRKILGLFLYFLVVFGTGSISSITSVSKLLSFSGFYSLTTLMKNLSKVSASFDSSLKTSLFLRSVIMEFVE